MNRSVCRHFGSCGGCSSQNLPYAEQLRTKTDTVTRLVRAAVPSAPAARPMIAASAEPWGFRQKAHFVFERGAMGHYARSSRRLLPVVECPVHDPRANELAFRFERAFRRLDDPSLEGIVVRSALGTNEIGVTLVFRREPVKRLRAATRTAIERAPGLTSLHINIHPKDDGYLFGRETRKIVGAERVRETVAGVSFLISPTSFFQTNIAAAEILVKLVIAEVRRPKAEVRGKAEGRGTEVEVPDAVGPVLLDPPTAVLDLYAGTGLFAIPLAKAGHTVIAVEENRAAVADGEASLRLNRIAPERCRFIAAPVEHALSQSLRQSPITDQRSPISTVVLDPPRDGCSREVIDRVFGGIRPSQAIYVSCDPNALARDVAAAVDHGYTIESLQPVDMFPHTPHIETVVALRRGPG